MFSLYDIIDKVLFIVFILYKKKKYKTVTLLHFENVPPSSMYKRLNCFHFEQKIITIFCPLDRTKSLLVTNKYSSRENRNRNRTI